MKGKARKVAIVGAGMVGSSCAYSMVNQSICDEIMMIDRTYDRALVHALDLSHCMGLRPHALRYVQARMQTARIWTW